MRGVLGGLSMTLMMTLSGAAAEPGSVLPQEWAAYKGAFVVDGRVIDTANGNISHSEGQGYGLLLAFLSDDAEGFERIWQFTQTELLVREDGLAAWKWDPTASPNITDDNNASDGDILIAYALILAGEAWDKPHYVEAARTIADAVGETSTMRWRGRDLLLPGSFGFRREDLGDGPVINLSYWVFEAFPVLARVAPTTDWLSIAQSGRRLVNEARFGPMQLPTDWMSLRGVEVAPATDFPAEFAYNSIRIPLYLMRSGSNEPALLRQFVAPLEGQEAATISVKTGSPVESLSEPGYRLIGAAAACLLDGTAIQPELLTFEPQSYFGATLQLLTLSYLRDSAQSCT